MKQKLGEYEQGARNDAIGYINKNWPYVSVKKIAQIFHLSEQSIISIIKKNNVKNKK